MIIQKEHSFLSVQCFKDFSLINVFIFTSFINCTGKTEVLHCFKYNEINFFLLFNMSTNVSSNNFFILFGDSVSICFFLCLYKDSNTTITFSINNFSLFSRSYLLGAQKFNGFIFAKCNRKKTAL